MGLLPALAISDPIDAELVFNALNAAYVTEEDVEKRQRLACLLIAARTDMRRTEGTEDND